MTPFTARKRHLARQILTAMGLSAGSMVILSACGTEVIVQPEDNPTSSSSNSSSASSSATGEIEFTCPNAELGAVYACIPLVDGECPSPDGAIPALDEQLGAECPTGDPDFCSCWEHVGSVPCGPDPSVTDACCYFANMVMDQVCEGRPFLVGGEQRLAEPCERDDWLYWDDTLLPRTDDLDAPTRAALAAAWTEDGLNEHASIASFARFVMELLAVGAPPDMIRDAQRAIADEVRHAELCFSLASAYAGKHLGPGSIGVEQSLDERRDLAAIAAATFIEGCVNETLATIVAHAAADAATDAAAERALDLIAADESRHAALAWRFVAWACRKNQDAARAVAQAFSEVESRKPGTQSRKPGSQGRLGDSAFTRHGQLPHDEQQHVIAQGYRDVVAPAAGRSYHHWVSILDHIGNTPLVPLAKIGAGVLAKCEHLNPGGSVKDRMALAIVDALERKGLAPGATLVEATAGNTGVALAMIAAVRGYSVVCVMPEKMSEDKRRALRGMGAEVIMTDNAPPGDPRNFQEVAKRIARERDAVLTDQFVAPANPAVHEATTGPEIWEQTGGEVAAFVAGAGTGGTITGVGRYLKGRRADIKIVLADPAGSRLAGLVNDGALGEDGSYLVEGIGGSVVPDTLDPSVIDWAEIVGDRDAFAMAERLVREEGLLVGGSAGTAVAAAVRVADKVDGPVVALLPDHWDRYQTTVFDSAWLSRAF